MKFKEFRDAVQIQAAKLLQNRVLYVTGADPDCLYDLYLSSFPQGTDEVYLTRTEHDCSACRQFIKSFGNVVAINGTKLTSVWDIDGLDSTYSPVVVALAQYVKSFPVINQFLSVNKKIGVAENRVLLSSGETHTWHHLSVNLLDNFVTSQDASVGSAISNLRDSKAVYQRSLQELTIDSVEAVLDLISQKSLYRGEEHQYVLQEFLKGLRCFAKLSPREQDLFCWEQAGKTSVSVLRIRNTSIGTLLIDLSTGVDLDTAVRKYESVVAPANYKRPKAIFSQKMLEAAQSKVIELGLMNSLERRHASIEDIRIGNILFANTDVARKVAPQNIFEQMQCVNPRKFAKVENVSVETFVSDILPRITDLKVLLENRHVNNLVSLIAPVDQDSPSLFKWNNAFSWSYSGAIADSMKQRVKDAGGNPDGVLRFTIQWNENSDNANDFDAHCIEPNGYHIYYPSKGLKHPSSGMLDVDIVHPRPEQVAIENITWQSLNQMPKGKYLLYVQTFRDRGGRSGFRAEIEFGGEIYSFDHPTPSYSGEVIEIAKIILSESNELSIQSLLPTNTSVTQKTLWNMPTNKFYPVTCAMLSPNYWDQQQGQGNKHYFFFLRDCVSSEPARGFFNEFLRNDLLPHKRVFEALTGKMEVANNDPSQLSGLGFSSTQRSSMIVQATGHVSRTIKINF